MNRCTHGRYIEGLQKLKLKKSVIASETEVKRAVLA